jgi:hypothetical protein
VFGIAVGRVISDTEGDVAHLPSDEQVEAGQVRTITGGPRAAGGN